MNTIPIFPRSAHPFPRFHQIIAALITLLTTLLLNSAQAAAPTLVSVTPNSAGTELYLSFSDPLCPNPFTLNVGAAHIPNYSLTPPGTISAATLLADQKTVRLDFAPALSGSYTLQIATLPGFEIYDCLSSSNRMATPVSMPVTVNGTLAGPVVYYTVPTSISTDCGTAVTVHGDGFDSTATLELIPGPITGTAPTVNAAGTTITATFPGGIAAGTYSVVVKNPAGAVLFPGQSTPPFAIQVLPVTIQGAWPSFLSACSSSTVTAIGGGFCPGATINAIPTGGGSPVPVSGIVVSPGGDQISGTFNFSGAPGGSYDLVVQNPGSGSSATRLSAIHITGISAWLAYPDRVGNCGTKTIQLTGNFCAGDIAQLTPIGGGSAIPGTVTSIVPSPLGHVMTIDFNLAGVTPGNYHVEIQRGAGPWIPTLPTIVVLPTTPCPLDVEILGRQSVGYTVVNTFTINVRNVSCAPVGASTLTLTVPAAATPALSGVTMGGVISPANVITYSVPTLNPGDLHQVQFNMLLPIIGTAINLSAVNSISGCNPVLHPITVVASQDPNSKDGLAGVGPNHYINGTETLPYVIHFENLASATAPAQDVFIYDRLNPAQFDLTSFSLGDITYGNQVITPPAGLTAYSTVIPSDVDGDPSTTGDEFLLVIDARLITTVTDPDYGRLTWSYRSIHPATLGDPLVGFLPPNDFPPLGEGSVKFSVKLQSGLPLGTQFGSAAVIIFDQNAPIPTNPWFNQIYPPVTLEITNNAGLIELTWLGAPGEWVLEETTSIIPPITWSTIGTTPISIPVGRQIRLAPASRAAQVFPPEKVIGPLPVLKQLLDRPVELERRGRSAESVIRTLTLHASTYQNA